MYVKDPNDPCQSSVDYGNIKITQHAPTLVSESSVLKLDTI